MYQIDLGTNPHTGKRDRPSASGKTRQEAKRKVDKKLRARSNNQPLFNAPLVNPLPDDDESYEEHNMYKTALEFIEIYKKESTNSETYRWYLDMAKHIRDNFGGRTVESITFIDRQNLVNKLAQNYGSTVIKQVRILYDNTLDLARKKGYISNVPHDDDFVVPKKRASTSVKKNSDKHLNKVKSIPDDILMRLLIAVEEDRDKFFEVMVYVLLHSGIRIGEFICLGKKDLDRDNLLIHIREAVTKEYELVAVIGQEHADTFALAADGTRPCENVKDYHVPGVLRKPGNVHQVMAGDLPAASRLLQTGAD